MNNCCENVLDEATIIAKDCGGNPVKASDSIATCANLTAAIAEAVDPLQGQLLGCDGNELPAGARVPTCANLTAAIAEAVDPLQGQLLGCDGNELPAGARVPTCANLTAAIAEAVDPLQGQLLGCDGNELPAGTRVPTCESLVATVTEAVSPKQGQLLDCDGNEVPAGARVMLCSDAPPVAKTVDLLVTKTASAATITAGDDVTYTVRVVNNGPFAADGAVVKDTLDSTLLTYNVSASVPITYTGGAAGPASTTIGALLTGFAIPTLPNDASATFTITATVKSTAADGATLINIATVAPPAGVVDGDPANNSAQATSSIYVPPPPPPPPPTLGCGCTALYVGSSGTAIACKQFDYQVTAAQAAAGLTIRLLRNSLISATVTATLTGSGGSETKTTSGSLFLASCNCDGPFATFDLGTFAPGNYSWSYFFTRTDTGASSGSCFFQITVT